MAITNIKFSDEPGSRSRKAWLILRDAAGQLYKFKGGNIPGIVVVTGERFIKNGKWSHTKWDLALASGVVALEGKNGWTTGKFKEGLETLSYKTITSWEDVAAAFGTTVAHARTFCEKDYPKFTKEIDELEKALAELK